MADHNQMTRSIPRLHKARLTGRKWASIAVANILMADPDTPQPERVIAALEAHGLQATVCEDGGHALYEMGLSQPDYFLIATNLPGVPAEAVVKTIRRLSNAPILVAGNNHEVHAAKTSLMAGATAWLARPYSADDIVSRLREVSGQARTEPLRGGRLRWGPLVLDPAAFVARVNGRDLSLPLKEFELLRILLLHAGHLVPLDHIRSSLWEPDEAPSANTVSVHVSRLRARLGGEASITSVRGKGYRLTLNPSNHD